VRIFSSALTSTQVQSLYNEYQCEDTSTFQTVLYTGNGSTQYVSSVGFEPDLVWVKNRSSSQQNHAWFDLVRGAQKEIRSDSTAAEANYSATPYSLTSFDSNGFTVSDITAGNYNVNGAVGGTYSGSAQFVAWNWKAGGDAVSNTDGTATNVQVSANQSAGFSIVTMDADSGVRTVGHGLSSAPELIIWKSRTSSTNYWQVLAQAANGGNGHLGRLALQRTDAFLTVSSVWNNTQPTSTVFTLGTSCIEKGVAYCWHSVAGYSKMGSYSGTGATGNIITGLGFEPVWLMVKRTDSSGNSWLIVDNKRIETNGNKSELFADTSSAESGSGYNITFDSDGFTLNTTTTNANASGGTYIYMAFK
jgi:hypothetical protein